MIESRQLDQAGSIAPAVGPVLKVKVSRSRKSEVRVKSNQLTVQELRVCFGVARGRTQAQIGEDLHLSLSTVKTHMARLLAKTKCHTQSELVSWLYRGGYMVNLKPEPRPGIVFSPREMSMIQHTVMGLEDSEIARRVVLSEASVKTYMVRIRTKVQANNRAHLAALAWQLGLVKMHWWDEAGVVLPPPLRSIMPYDPDVYSGIPLNCPTCGAPSMPLPKTTTNEWVQDSIW